MIDYNDLLGKKFKVNAKGPDEFDCYTLCQEVLRRAGKNLPDFDYSIDTKERENLIKINKDCLVEKIEKPEPFALVLLKVHPRYTHHVAVMLDQTRFIHIMDKTSVTVDKIDSLIWKNKVRGFFRVRERESNGQ